MSQLGKLVTLQDIYMQQPDLPSSISRILATFHCIAIWTAKMQRDSELEVDARQNGLHFPSTGNNLKYPVPNTTPPGTDPDAGVVNSPICKAPESQKRIFRLRQTTFILSILLAVVLALGVTSAALAGHYAARASRIPEPVSNPDCPAANSVNGPNNSGGSSSSTNNSTLSLIPTTNCTSLGTQYTAPYTRALFNLHCKTDFVGNDLFGTFTYTFEDCINNCALFNQKYNSHGLGNCTGVSYTVNATAFPPWYKGNCFLEGASGGGSDSPDTSSAVTVTS